MQKENTATFVTIALTFAALSFLGILAINPTLSTIFDLRKQLADKQATEKQLATKIINFSLLQQQYNQIEPTLPVVFDAIPKSANAPLLSAQVESLAKREKLSITTYRVAEVQLASGDQKKSTVASYIFTLQASGDYNAMLRFSSALSKLSRIITIESMSIGRAETTEPLLLTIRGRQYFKP